MKGQLTPPKLSKKEREIIKSKMIDLNDHVELERHKKASRIPEGMF